METESGFPGYERVVFPGPLFAGYPRDLEDTAKGEERGFYIVYFDDIVQDAKFIEVSVCGFEYFEYDVTDKNSVQARKALLEKLGKIEVQDKIAVVKIKGTLSGGKTSEVSSSEIRDLLKDNGALEVIVNRYGLTSKDYTPVTVKGEDTPAIESRLLRENIGAVKVSAEELKADKGAELAQELLKILRQEQRVNETKKDYEERVQKHAWASLGLGDERQ